MRDDKVCGLTYLGGGDAKFGGTCVKWNIMVHELLHSLMFSHEQSRVDRDKWVKFPSGCHPDSIDDEKNYIPPELLYDYRSCMHYECNQCLVPSRPGVKGCGHSTGLGVLDIDKVNAYYNCKGCLGHRWKQGNKVDHGYVGGQDTDGSKLHVCRAYYMGDIIPGKGVPKKGCWVTYNGGEHKVTDEYEILTNDNNANLKWVKETGNDKIPAGAIKGGRAENGDELYIGRCTISENNKSTLVIGKVHLQANKGASVPFNGKEYLCSSYELLVCQ